MQLCRFRDYTYLENAVVLRQWAMLVSSRKAAKGITL